MIYACLDLAEEVLKSVSAPLTESLPRLALKAIVTGRFDCAKKQS